VTPGNKLSKLLVSSHLATKYKTNTYNWLDNYWYEWENKMTKNYPPGPKGNILLGSTLQFRKDQLSFLTNSANQYGKISFFRLGPYKVFLINDPEYIQEILVKNTKNVTRTKFIKTLLGKFLGNGILTNDGESHARQRRLVQPAFHTQRIVNYAEVMVDYTEQMVAGWENGQTVDIDDAMMKITMRIVSKTLFDAEVSTAANGIGDAVAELQTITISEFKNGFSMPDWLPIKRNNKRKAATKVLDDAIRQFIHDRRQSGEDRGDLLSMLLLAQDEDDGGMMNDQQVRDEAITLFAAGHETTSNALTWTWYLLSQHPAVMEKLQDELDTVLGDRPPTFDDLENLTYTEMVIKESMRLYPPAWLLMSRTPTKPLIIGGYQIDPGEWIFISPYVTHRNKTLYTDHERFDPQRFTKDEEAKLHRYAYLPFGGGNRICIGNAFAMMEARLILSTIAQRFDFHLVPGQQIIPEPEITMRPRYGLNMTVKPRK
jgi:cytochrome P450